MVRDDNPFGLFSFVTGSGRYGDAHGGLNGRFSFKLLSPDRAVAQFAASVEDTDKLVFRRSRILPSNMSQRHERPLHQTVCSHPRREAMLKRKTLQAGKRHSMILLFRVRVSKGRAVSGARPCNLSIASFKDFW